MFIDFKGQRCVFNEEWLILDDTYPPEHHSHEVAKFHQTITDQETVGSSGLPDPKEITIGDTNYRFLTDAEFRCYLCEDQGDMIPPEQRFKGSKYKPGAPTKKDG